MEENRVSIMLILRNGDTDYFSYFLQKEGDTGIKEVSTSEDTAVFWNIVPGNYQIKVKACQRDRVELTKSTCSAYSPIQSVILENSLKSAQKNILASIEASNKETQLITLMAHARILEFLKYADEATIKQDTNLKNAFNVALIGPDAMAHIFNSSSFVVNAQKVFPGLDPSQDQNQTSAPPVSSTTQVKTSNALPTILITTGSIGLVLSIAALGGLYGIQRTKNWAAVRFDNISADVVKFVNKHPPGNRDEKGNAATIWDMLDNETVVKKVTFLEESWKKMAFSQAEAQALFQEISQQMKILVNIKVTGTGSARQIEFTDKQNAFIKRMLYAVDIPSDKPGDPPDKFVSIDQTKLIDPSYRQRILHRFQTILLKDVGAPTFDATNKADLKIGDSVLTDVVMRDRVRTNFNNLVLENLNLENKNLSDYIFYENQKNKLFQKITNEEKELKKIQQDMEANSKTIEKSETELRALTEAGSYKVPKDFDPIRENLKKEYQIKRDLYASHLKIMEEKVGIDEYVENKAELEAKMTEAIEFLDKLGKIPSESAEVPADSREVMKKAFKENNDILAERNEILKRRLDRFVEIQRWENADPKEFLEKLAELKEKLTPDEKASEALRREHYDAYKGKIDNINRSNEEIKKFYYDEKGMADMEARLASWFHDNIRYLASDLTQRSVNDIARILNDAVRQFLEGERVNFKEKYPQKIKQKITRPIAYGLGVDKNLSELGDFLVTKKLVASEQALSELTRERMDNVLREVAGRRMRDMHFEAVAWGKSAKDSLVEWKGYSEKMSAGTDSSIKWGGGGALFAAIISSAAIVAGYTISELSLADNTSSELSVDMESGLLHYLNLGLINNILWRKQLLSE